MFTNYDPYKFICIWSIVTNKNLHNNISSLVEVNKAITDWIGKRADSVKISSRQYIIITGILVNHYVLHKQSVSSVHCGLAGWSSMEVRGVYCPVATVTTTTLHRRYGVVLCGGLEQGVTKLITTFSVFVT